MASWAVSVLLVLPAASGLLNLAAPPRAPAPRMVEAPTREELDALRARLLTKIDAYEEAVVAQRALETKQSARAQTAPAAAPLSISDQK